MALAHSLILHVHELCAKVSGLLRNYKSIGLFESLCKTLQALARVDNRWTDVFGQDSREILFAGHNSYHLNTKHLKSKHLTLKTLFGSDFKWSEDMIRWII